MEWEIETYYLPKLMNKGWNLFFKRPEIWWRTTMQASKWVDYVAFGKAAAFALLNGAAVNGFGRVFKWIKGSLTGKDILVRSPKQHYFATVLKIEIHHYFPSGCLRSFCFPVASFQRHVPCYILEIIVFPVPGKAQVLKGFWNALLPGVSLG